MPSTETKHLTTLNFDITQMEAQLRSIPASVEQAARDAQAAWNDNFSAGLNSGANGVGGGNGGGSNGGGSNNETRGLTLTTDAVNRLIDRYTALQEKLAGKSFVGSQFGELRTEVTATLETLGQLKTTLVGGFEVDDFGAREFTDARSRLVELNTTLKEANISVLDFKNKIGGESKQLSTSEFDKVISKLRDIQLQYGAAQSKAENATWGDGRIREIGASFGVVKNSINEYVSNLIRAGGATTEDSARIDALTSHLQKLNIQYQEAAKTAQANYAAEQQRNALIKESTTLTDKQSAAIKRMENSRQKSINRDTITSMKGLNVETQNLIQRFQAGEMSSDQFRASLDELIAKTRQLEGTVRTTGSGVNDFFTKISDKAKWLASFYLIQGVINGFKALITTVKETESTVVELQRVLNEDVASPEISSQLYDIAYEYGRTFDEVQESAVLFAQTGKSWNDVLTLTRGTMLALNTAELDVTQATQGLIAIMAQWNLGAEDYVALIDKINITADNYAITSEAIVEAMKRSSSTASAYGFTLEELIGVITALGEATGRSGENLGTAINSLIIYTTRAKSIDVLKKMKIDAEDAEGNLRPVLDIWSELAQKIHGGDLAFAEFMAQDQESIGEFLADSEEYKAAVEKSISMGEDVQDAYSIAGTYRRNYFIALLQNLTTAEEAVAGMTDAEGRSVAENEKYMATLDAISNQLSASWRKLAVEFGDASFLKFLKWVTDLGIGIAKLIGNTGGLTTSLFLFLGVLTVIKAQQISEMFIGWYKAINNLKVGFKAAATGAELLQVAMGWVGLITAAISVLVGGVNAFTSAIEDSRQKTLEEGDAARETSDSLDKLIQKYKELASTSEYAAGSESALSSARSIHEDIVALLGDQEVGWDLVNGKVDENIAKLIQARYENAKNQSEFYKSAVNVGEKELQSFEKFTLGEYGVLYRALQKTGDTSTQTFGAQAEVHRALIEGGAQGVIELLEQWRVKFNELGTDGANAVGIINLMLAAYRENIEKADEANTNAANNQAIQDAYDEHTKGLITTQAEYDNYIEILKQAAIQERVTVEYAEAMRKEMDLLYPEFASVADASDRLQYSLGDLTLDDTLNTAELAAAAFKDTQDQVNEFASSMEALNGVVSEYNETGIMTTEMLNSLLGLSSEYLALLDVTSGGLSVNKDATDDLIDSKQGLIKAMIDEKFYLEAVAAAEEYANAQKTDEAWQAYVDAASGAHALSGELWGVVTAAASTANSVESATAAIAAQLKTMGYSAAQAGALAARLGTVAFAYRNVTAAASGLSLGAFGGAASTQKASGGGGGGGGEDPQIKILEDRKKAIEETAQAQIDALKEVQEAEDRKRRRDDYLADKSEALADVRRAQSRSGIEAREDEANAEKKLAEVNSDWQEQLQDWNLDDQIASIEAWKEAMVDAIDAQLDALKNAGGGGGGGGGGSTEGLFGSEAEVLTQNKDVLLSALAEMDNENLSERIKEFYKLFDASQYTSDVDFSDQLAGIKTDWNTFEAENGDEFAIHYKTVLDDGTSLTQEQLTEYLDGLAAKAANESEFFQLDQGTGGLGILLRVTPSTETDQATEDQWSQTVNDLGEALDKMLSLWEFDNLDLEATKKAIEDAFNGAFSAAEQSATDSGVVIEQQMSKAADDTGASMLSAVNGYSPQIVDAWNNNLINPMIDGLGNLSGTLDGVLTKLGNVAAFGGITGIGGGVNATTGNTTQSQTNFITLRGGGKSQTDPLARWFI